MATNSQIRLYETRTILKVDGATGTDEADFYVVSGSRVLVTLQVLSADPGATATLNVGNTFDADLGYESIGTGQVAGVGNVKRVFSDFNNLFRIGVTVAGGAVSYRVAIAIFDNASTTRIENAQISVDLSDIADTLGHYDALRIGDGEGDYLAINDDGSINVNLDNAQDEEAVNPYGESPAVPTGSPSDVVTYVVPNGKIALLYRVEASGENVARFQVTINGDVLATRRTHHGSGLTTDFEFCTPNKRAVVLQAGDTLKVVALHNRPQSGDFEARAQLLLKDAP